MENEQDELRSITRLHNKTLRNVNRLLRRRQEQIAADTDEKIAALFEGQSLAEHALEEIWEKAGLSIICSPDDYQAIVDVCVEQLAARGYTAARGTSTHV